MIDEESSIQNSSSEEDSFIDDSSVEEGDEIITPSRTRTLFNLDQFKPKLPPQYFDATKINCK